MEDRVPTVSRFQWKVGSRFEIGQVQRAAQESTHTDPGQGKNQKHKLLHVAMNGLVVLPYGPETVHVRTNLIDSPAAAGMPLRTLTGGYAAGCDL